jgi:hypothetical protein
MHLLVGCVLLRIVAIRCFASSIKRPTKSEQKGDVSDCAKLDRTIPRVIYSGSRTLKSSGALSVKPIQGSKQFDQSPLLIEFFEVSDNSGRGSFDRYTRVCVWWRVAMMI